MESVGHTMALSKYADLVIFYDNYYGAYEISGDVGKELSKHFLQWGFPEIRFYSAKSKPGELKNVSTEKSD